MVHLHTKSCYSLLESPLRIDEICDAAVSSGQKAAVLTDHNTMFGTMEFIHACEKRGLQPIIGLETEIQRGLNSHPVILLAGNTQGLQDLFALSTRLCQQNGEAIGTEDLAAYTANAIVIGAAGDEVIEEICKSNNMTTLQEILQEFSDAFPQFYTAMSLNDSPRFRSSNRFLKVVSDALGISSVAVSRIEYLRPEDEETARLLSAIDHQTTINDRTLKVRSGRYVRSPEEMEALYEPEDLEMSDHIASMILPYELPKASLPVFPNKMDADSEKYLRSLCIAGLKKRLNGKIPAVYAARLEEELSVILSMGFADYFLIVWDFIREARSRNILVGPGRGSAAGSLVAWVLGIAHIDPVANGLLFERFLNPERVSMPDIDTDFPDDRRDEILRYVQEKYGTGHAAHIVTYARLKARLALRDTARAMGILQADVDKLAKLIPSGPNTTLQETYEQSAVFKGRVESNPVYSQLYKLARSIEGLPRHASIHAGGIVLARDSIVNQAPLIDLGADLPVVQFSMESLEELGLIKFDFLALKNLSLLAAMNARIEQETGKALALLQLPLNDPAVYQMLCKGTTMGIFQLESEGIRQLILRYHPQRFEDIAAIIALYRPGPMKNIDLFLQARHQGRKTPSLHPLLDPILSETGGIFLYQEQIMEAARTIGGFTLAQADILRKAMSKKKRDVMESWKVKFIEGAEKQGIHKEDAAHIFDVMEEFADYGFNKSHSYAYGMLVYQMAYIKAHYPAIFYTCCLDGCMSSEGKTMQYLREAELLHLHALPVSINQSAEHYQIMQGKLRMPFTLLKGISTQTTRKILQDREARGDFQDPVLAIARLSDAGLSRKEIQILIQAGAFDELGRTDRNGYGINRESILTDFDQIITVSTLITRTEDGQLRFDNITPPQLQPQPVNRMQRLTDEKEVYGFFISEHPSIELRRKNPRLKSTQDLAGYAGKVSIAGTIVRVKEHKTKKGQKMAFATLQDDLGEIELAIMPNYWTALQGQNLQGNFYIVEGRKDRERSLIPNQLIPARIE